MRLLVKLEQWNGIEIWLNGCETCGHIWIQATEVIPSRCSNHDCQTSVWNGRNPKKTVGRKDKGLVREQSHKPVFDAASQDGIHSKLCACMMCLLDTQEQIEATELEQKALRQIEGREGGWIRSGKTRKGKAMPRTRKRVGRWVHPSKRTGGVQPGRAAGGSIAAKPTPATALPASTKALRCPE